MDTYASYNDEYFDPDNIVDEDWPEEEYMMDLNLVSKDIYKVWKKLNF